MEVLQSRPAVLKLIDKLSKRQKFNNYEISNIKTNKKGEGYLGEIFMITIKNSDSNDQLNVLIKAAFTQEVVRNAVPIGKAFENEMYFYSTVYPDLQKFTEERGFISNVELIPQCLAISTNNGEEMLALENLRVLGFNTFSKKSTLDHDHIKLIFERYGQYHAYSYALKDQKPDQYAKIVANFQDLFIDFMKKDHSFGSYIMGLNKTVEASLIPGKDDKVIEAYEKYSGEKILKNFEEASTPSDSYTGILHGDCWSNNMMFKYKDSKPIDMRLIDWQIIKEGSPVCDLSYCLYSGATKDVFDKLDYYLKTYYAVFSATLKKLGSDPELLYSFQTLKKHWQKHSKFGMIMAFGIIKMKLTPDVELLDFTDLKENENVLTVFDNKSFDQKTYEKRIRDLLLHMYEIQAL